MNDRPTAFQRRLRVDVLQPLGSDVIAQIKLTSQLDERLLTDLVPADLQIKTDDRIGVQFNRDRLHVFEAKNGTRMN